MIPVRSGEYAPEGHNGTTLSSELRAWATGDYCYEAAVEMLLRGFHGRFAQNINPWVCPDGLTGRTSVDFASIPYHIAGCSKVEQQFLLFAASLAEGIEINLADVIPGLERAEVELILAAISHASASHECPPSAAGNDGPTRAAPMTALYPWPGDEPRIRIVQ
ncbi:hypothetical protein [Arthrobacter sp. M4]|uniref:hypothetical protein n=1 Tax=Arthrobacter sp. M4 TaxID=218160 RepID=UPI001CDC7903|nr:hypothetical protein [Arthrobacter sp. M4]MCA4132900.1 hypothetical protein [Arthrobacter sp. M4]